MPEERIAAAEDGIDAEEEAKEIASLLGPGGPIARTLEAAGAPYEERPQQREMARAVHAGLSSGRHVVVEAGTGVGKSFAYLVPTLLWAVRRGAKVAVSTATIALQEQLVRKDLPLLASALPFSFTYALVKGRGNYLCKRRMHLALSDAAGLFPEDASRRALEAVRDWSQTTGEGSRQDLAFPVPEEVWDAVRAEPGNCLHKACRFYAECPYQRSRRERYGADLLVVNHHVLMADLVLKRSGGTFLPEVDAVVIDEAHALEDVASEHLGGRVSFPGVAYSLGRLWSPRQRGLLSRLPVPSLRTAVEETRSAAKNFFGDVERWLRTRGESGAAARIPDPFPVRDTLASRLRSLAGSLAASAGAAPDPDLALETGARARGIEALAATVERLAGADVAGEVRWAESDGRGVALSSAPVEVGGPLQEVLWEAFRTVVLTSATLAAGSPPTFEYLRERLGLAEADEALLGSPFDFAKQARIVVRADLPDPVREPARFDAALPRAVLEAVRRTSGGAFVLFTSTATMRAAAEAVRADLSGDGLLVLVQGEGIERPQMLERFRRENAVLFGVASFWQGVDVPGDALRHVVIARLPFDVPTHPLQEARRERLEASGKDAFAHMSLPSAALRLKQGFGRLVRRATDRGVVTILDPRIVRRPYGRFLLGSLPECPVDVIGGDGVALPSFPEA